jgi:hypothetical protein
MPVARISLVSVRKSHQPGCWHGTQNRCTSSDFKAYDLQPEAGMTANNAAMAPNTQNRECESHLPR